ncbi:GIY-YIG nuclease family protein [Escherichia coli]|uniref:GIY-YIG nuclease family protein n=1 Tax=Escherichia coli TaxID=562 RepID=UPI000BEA5023|nr:GIY-YIG nuclease family protein [Escherichia coli]
MCHCYKKAADIEAVRTFHHNAVMPSVYEDRLTNRCNEIGYTFLGFVGEWNGKKTRAGFVCDCGHEFDASVDSFLNAGSKCMQCYLDNKMMTEDDATAKVNSVLGDYIFVGFDGGYKGANNKTRLHLICDNGHEYKPLFKNFVYAGVRCGRCAGKSAYEIDDIKKNIDQVRGNHVFIGIVGDWKGTNHSIIKMCCPNNHEYEIAYRNFVINGNRCAVCSGNKRLSEVDAIEKIDSVRGDHEFVGFVSGYVNNSSKIIMKCVCGHQYTVTFTNFMKGRRCAKCASHGYNIGKSGHLYVQHIPEVNAIKIGITNRAPEQRKRQHELESKLEHRIVFSWEFEDGSKAKRIEDEFKRKYKDRMKFVSKEVMPDGWTETLPADILPTFLKEVKSMCNIENVVSN